MIPTVPSFGDSGEINYLESIMQSIKLVTDYTKMSQDKVLQMYHDYFLLNLKYAFINEKMQSEEGRAYLKKAYRLRQTEPDYKGIKELQGKLKHS